MEELNAQIDNDAIDDQIEAYYHRPALQTVDER